MIIVWADGLGGFKLSSFRKDTPCLDVGDEGWATRGCLVVEERECGDRKRKIDSCRTASRNNSWPLWNAVDRGEDRQDAQSCMISSDSREDLGELRVDVALSSEHMLCS